MRRGAVRKTCSIAGRQVPLGHRETGDLGVGGVGHEQVDPLLAEAGEGPQVGDPLVQRELVHLEVAGVQDQARRGPDGDREAVGDRVVDRDELEVEHALGGAVALLDLAQLGADAVLLELLPDQRQREAGPDEGDVRPLLQQVGDAADVVLVPVGEDHPDHLVEAITDRGEVGQDHVDAGLVLLGEQHPAVDDQQRALVLEHGHVATDLAQPAQGHDAEAVPGQLRGLLELGMRVAHRACPFSAWSTGSTRRGHAEVAHGAPGSLGVLVPSVEVPGGDGCTGCSGAPRRCASTFEAKPSSRARSRCDWSVTPNRSTTAGRAGSSRETWMRARAPKDHGRLPRRPCLIWCAGVHPRTRRQRGRVLHADCSPAPRLPPGPAPCCRQGAPDRGVLMSFDTELDPDDISTNPTPGPCFNEIIERRATRRTVLATGGATAAATFLTTALPGGPAAAHGGTRSAQAPPAGIRARPAQHRRRSRRSRGVHGAAVHPLGNPPHRESPGLRARHPALRAGREHGRRPGAAGGHAPRRHALLRTRRRPPRPPPRPSTHRPRPARGQPRVHRRGLPAHRHQHAAGQDVLDRRHGPQVPARPRRLGGGDRGGVPRFLVRRPPVAAEPADHRQHADVLLRPRGRPPAGPHLGRPGRPRPRGHPQQLLARRDPVGHLPRPARRTSTATSASTPARYTAEQQALQARSASAGTATTGPIHDDRFVVTAEDPNEPNRFGWVVEIDPFDPDSDAGQAHRARPGQARGRLRARRQGRPRRRLHRRRPGQRVRLQVRQRRQLARGPRPRAGARWTRARCTSRGSTTTAPGEWLPLVHGDGPLTADSGYADQADVLVEDAARGRRRRRHPDGPPRVDRGAPATPAMVYVTLTNNTSPAKVAERRQPAQAEPVGPHRPLAGGRGRPHLHHVRVGPVPPGRAGPRLGRRLHHRRGGRLRLPGRDLGSTPTVGCGSRPTAPSPRDANDQMLAANPYRVDAARDTGAAPVPDRRAGLRGDRRGDHARPAHHVRQHPAPG